MYLIVCDSPDPQSAVCTHVEASGLLVLGEGIDTADLYLYLGAIALVFGTAYVIKLILRTMGFK